MKRILILSLIAIFASSCQQEKIQDDQQQPAVVGAKQLEAASSPIVDERPMLPAYKLPGDFKPLKADQYSDYRDSHPEVYGITEPPGVAFRPVAEYEPAARLMITVSSTGLPSGMMENLVDICKHGKDVVETYVLYPTNTIKNSFQNMLSNGGVSSNSVTWLKMDMDSVWVRDFGPVPIISDSGKNGIVDLRYYHQRIYDDAIPTKLGSLWNMSVYRTPLDFEGGNFMSDTKGNCFTSEGILYYNGVSQTEIEKYAKDYVGCDKLYITKPMEGEGTTHIDMAGKIIDDNTIVCGEYKSNEDYANNKILNQNAAMYEAAGFNVVRMPMPSNSDGNFRSYINSLFVNGVNMWPTYSIDKAKEAEALEIWEDMMPTWEHVKMNSDDVIKWAGAIHCITMTTGNGSFSKMEADPDYACGGDWACYPGSSGGGCEGITYEGCCDGNILKYCEGGSLKSSNCGNQPQCGWDSQNKFYNCGTNGGADPSGKYPKNCGTECVPSCAGKECGSDGCGGSCGNCPNGTSCTGGKCVEQVDECDGITYEGCCEGNILKYCEDGELVVVDCGGAPKCGWKAAGKFYDCGTQGGSDPSGVFKKDCSGGCEPDCTAKECGDNGCGGSCGTCTGGEKCQSWKCVCVPDCGGKDCGSDGCGGSCGTCTGSDKCTPAGQCIPDCQPDCAGKDCGDDGCGGSCGQCGAGQLCQYGKCNDVEDPCLGITWEGCCDGATLHYCEDIQLTAIECGDAGCGWNSQAGYYDCKQAGADPSGANPIACPGVECIPNCADKVCGDNGCGGSCGICGPNQYCDSGMCIGGDGCGDVTYAGKCEGNVLVWCENGKLYEADCSQLPGDYKCEYAEPAEQEAGYYCVPQPDCEPDCTNKECGDDGCGASCGKCAEGESCKDGSCQAGPCEPDCAGAECGDDGCGGSCGQCPGGWKCQMGHCATECQPNCANKECGDDGCDGLCGSCSVGESCVDGACQAGPCEPDCTGLECGDDGCEGSCGACGDSETCAEGTCIGICQPDCQGKECGNDGCDGSCGVCEPGFSCNGNVCKEGCEPDCAGKQCGDNGCGESCGTCPPGEVCTEGGCSPECVPSCDGKDCGPDGCGGSCGNCPKDFSCDNGSCVQDPDGCGNVTSVGECDGAVLNKCVSNQIISINCADTGKVCSFVPNSGVFDCVAECIPNCAGKACGDDGCGGTCGSCPKGEGCENGQCAKSVECTPECTGKVCGSDGCGGACGACAPGQSCDPAGQCAKVIIDDPDVTGEDAVVAEGDEPPEPGSSSDGCTAGTRGSVPALFLLLSLLMGVFVVRRRLAWSGE